MKMTDKVKCPMCEILNDSCNARDKEMAEMSRIIQRQGEKIACMKEALEYYAKCNAVDEDTGVEIFVGDRAKEALEKIK